MAFELDKILASINLAEEMDEKELDEIGEEVVKGYEADCTSRDQWEQQNEEWMRLALQAKVNKTFPWPHAANVKYPLLTTAALQFSSRAYPSLVPSCDVVKARPIGPDPMGEAMGVAEKISTHMSYQVLYEMDDWEENMDKLCLILPIIGCAFKKTYYSHIKEKNCSELVFPKDLVVNYWAKSLESASRKTQRFWLTPNEIVERQRLELYKEWDDLEFGPGSLDKSINKLNSDPSELTPPPVDEHTPRLTLEQHTYLDLDDDGYKEPYVVIVDFETKKVHRIAARFRQKDVKLNGKGKIQRIKACEYFTKFGFIPNPDGGFYDVGFGLLLGSLNESANTAINQLLDAGSLSNLQSGFLAKGLRIGQTGEVKFRPGEWKWVNNSYEDLKKGIFPMPVRDPSPVLFQLLGMLLQSGKELASIAEIFTGKMPGQNTPASTTMATIEQGLKVFTSIYKRIYRALGKEFEKLFELNEVYLPEAGQNYSYERNGQMVDETVTPELYSQVKVKIIPAADPNMVTETQKLLQLQAMIELAQFGQMNLQELTRRGLEVHNVSNISKLLNTEPPPPDPKIVIEEKKLAQENAHFEITTQLEAAKLKSESLERQTKGILNLAKAEEAGMQTDLAMLQMELDKLVSQEESIRSHVESIMAAHNSAADRNLKREEIDARSRDNKERVESMARAPSK